MNDFDIVVICVCVLLLAMKATREGALILLASNLIYFVLIIDTKWTVYYSVLALLNIVTGIFLQDKYKISAFCSYSLVIVSVLGFWLRYKNYPPDLFNVICWIILSIQLIFFIPRILSHGRDGNNFKYPVAFLDGLDRCAAHDTMRYKQKRRQAR